jgi:hypothetical protein
MNKRCNMYKVEYGDIAIEQAVCVSADCTQEEERLTVARLLKQAYRDAIIAKNKLATKEDIRLTDKVVDIINHAASNATASAG